MTKILFREEQRFSQFWIWIIILGTAALWLWQLIQQIFLGIPFGNNPAPDGVVIAMGAIPATILIIFKTLRLETVIDQDGVHCRFKPFQRKFKVIKPGDIARWEVKKYSPVKDYGGWGIRTGSLWGKGTAYNVSGNQGIYFELKNGKKFLIGTQSPTSANAAMKKLMSAE